MRSRFCVVQRNMGTLSVIASTVGSAARLVIPTGVLTFALAATAHATSIAVPRIAAITVSGRISVSPGEVFTGLPDGKHIACAEYDGRDGFTRVVVRPLFGHGRRKLVARIHGDVRLIACAPTGDTLAALADSGVLYLLADVAHLSLAAPDSQRISITAIPDVAYGQPCFATDGNYVVTHGERLPETACVTIVNVSRHTVRNCHAPADDAGVALLARADGSVALAGTPWRVSMDGSFHRGSMISQVSLFDCYAGPVLQDPLYVHAAQTCIGVGPHLDMMVVRTRLWIIAADGRVVARIPWDPGSEIREMEAAGSDSLYIDASPRRGRRHRALLYRITPVSGGEGEPAYPTNKRGAPTRTKAPRISWTTAE